ncbi:Carbohydrate kinase (fragment) [Mesorhizobium metallidurans STM 2683]|uniref:Carbohydrate kinase n=1 Tax=Mesorhizobium metallidurans STM 2683 TaxID=1297569 RepID=M5EQD2_9HYPH
MVLAAGKPIFAIGVSPDKAERLTPVLGSLALAFMDRREATALASADATDQDLVGGLRRAGLSSGVVTAGNGLVLGFDETGAFSVLPPTRKIVDVAGAGDVLAGATVAALLNGLALPAALREGVAAAMLAIENAELAPAFTAAAFAEALALVPEARELA